MSHHPPIEPFTPSPTTQIPHPVLQAVLDNLDVQLEEELARYRRQRRYPTDRLGQSPASRPRPGAMGQSPVKRSAPIPEFGSAPSFTGNAAFVRSPDTMADSVASAVSARVGSSPLKRSTVTPASPAQPGRTLTAPSLTSQPKTTQAEPAQPPMAPPIPRVPVEPSTKSRFSARGNTAVAVAPLPVAPPPAEVPTPPAEPPTVAPEADGIASFARQRDLSAFEPSSAIQKFVHADAAVPEDYLESSEELLKSIAEEDPELRAEREDRLLETLLTPLGIGSMLLLLLSSASLGYIIMNPSSLGFLSAKNQGAANSVATPSGQNRTTINLQTTPIDTAPPSPDLAADEFHDINLGTLSTLPKGNRSTPANTASKTAPAPASTVKPSPVAASAAPPSASPAQPAPAIAAAPAAPEVVSTTDLPSVPVESKPPAPEPEPPAPEVSYAAPPPVVEPEAPKSAAAPAPAQSAPSNQYYYVVTEYSGDPGLQQVRTAVPDAYVRNLPSSGAKVQLGAFSSEAAAQERLNELQQQGISAQIYQP